MKGCQLKMNIKQRIEIAIMFSLCFSVTFFVSLAPIRLFFTLAILIVLYNIYSDKESGMRNIPLILKVSIFCFALGVLISSLVADDYECLLSCKKTISLLSYFIIGFLLAKKSKSNLLNVVALFIAILGLAIPAIQSFMLTGKRAQGILGNPNSLAAMFDVTLPFCIVFCVKFWRESEKRWIKIVTTTIIMIGCLGLYTTGSRGGMLAVSLSLLLVYGFTKFHKKGVAISLIALIVTGFLAHSGPNLLKGSLVSRGYDNERVLLMKSSYNMWSDNKLFGVGLSNWSKQYKSKYIFKEAKEPNLPTSHNIYTEVFATTGLFGGVPFVFMFLSILGFLGSNAGIYGGYYTYAMLGTLLAFLIHGFFDVLTVSWLMKPFYLLLGISVAEIVKDKLR